MKGAVVGTRRPTAEEGKVLGQLLTEQLAYFKGSPEVTKNFLKVGGGGKGPELAAWSAVASAVASVLDESSQPTVRLSASSAPNSFPDICELPEGGLLPVSTAWVSPRYRVPACPARLSSWPRIRWPSAGSWRNSSAPPT